MTPVVVHRYSWLITEAIEALLGDDAGDAKGWRMRIEGDELVVDIVAPVSRLPQPESEEPPPASNDAPKEETNSVNSFPEKAVSGQPERKGGALARSAAIIGGEKGFWIFAEKKHGAFLASADDARAWFCEICGIESRAELDHDARAATIFKPIEKAYRLWLEGWD